MVILFVTPYLGVRGEIDKGGGLESYLLRVAGALKKMGHTTIIMSLGSREIHYIKDGVEHIFIGSPHKILPIHGRIGLLYDRIVTSIHMNKKITQLLKQRHIDIIQFPSPYALALCYFAKTPAVMRLSSYSKMYGAFDAYDKREMDLYGLCERLAAKRCNAVFGPSVLVADIFSADIHRPVSVIESPFWNNCGEYDYSIYNEKLMNKKYFLYFGRLTEEKGTLVIAKCLRKFLETNPSFYFVCCGQSVNINGKDAAGILKKAAGRYKNRFIYMQSLPHEKLYPIIQHASCVVCTSIIENLSNSCIEAMYFERLVIGTYGASYDQLIDDGKNGLLCKAGNSISLLQKMNVAAVMDEKQRMEIGKRAKKRIERLAPEYVVEKLIRYYQYVINNVSK